MPDRPFVSAAALRADEPGRVRIVDHHEGIVAIGEITNLLQACYDAVHGEYPVGRDETDSRPARFLEARFELIHVVVRIAQTPRFAQADAVDDARVIRSKRNRGSYPPCRESASTALRDPYGWSACRR